MKTRLDENSLNTYREILKELPKKRQMVLEVFIELNRAISSFMVAQILNTSIHNVVGRINELRFVHQLIVKDGEETVNGKKRNLYRLRANGELPDGRKKTKLERITEIFDDMEINLITNKDIHHPNNYINMIEDYHNKIRNILNEK